MSDIRSDGHQTIKAAPQSWRRIPLFWPIGLLLVLLAEIFYFNLPFWQSLAYRPATAAQVTFSHGWKRADRGGHLLPGWLDPTKMPPLTAQTDGHPLNDPQGSLVGLSDIRGQVKSLHLDFSLQGQLTVDAQIRYYGPGYQQGENFGTIVLTNAAQDIRIFPPAAPTKLEILFPQLTQGSTLQLRSVSFNQPRSFNLSAARLALMASLVVLVGLIRPRSFAWRQAALSPDRRGKQALGGISLIWVLVFLALTFFLVRGQFIDYTDPGLVPSRATYQWSADGLLAGQPWLPVKPPHFLSTVSDPYDPGLREQAAQAAGQGYFKDIAFFHGRYYSYFGLVPTLLFFLPFKALTGQDLGYAWPFAICTLACLAILYFLIRACLERWAPAARLGARLTLLVCAPALGLGIFFTDYGKVYSIPQVSGLTFALLALLCWLRASRDPDRTQLLWVILGSLSFALVFGCRPSLVGGALLALPIFWRQLAAGLWKGKAGLLRFTAILLPFVVGVIPLLWWNRLRFGSLLDFGEKYQLTWPNVAHQSPLPPKLLTGFIQFFINPPQLSPNFPYVNFAYIRTGFTYPTTAPTYSGQFVMHWMGSYGYFLTFPLALLFFSLLWFAGRRRRVELRLLMTTSLLVVLALFLVTLQSAGIELRYQSDWNWVFAPGIIAAVGLLDQHIQSLSKLEPDVVDGEPSAVGKLGAQAWQRLLFGLALATLLAILLLTLGGMIFQTATFYQVRDVLAPL